MKFLEKAKQIRPDLTERQIIFKCPNKLGLEKNSICPSDENDNVTDEGCIYCWNREI